MNHCYLKGGAQPPCPPPPLRFSATGIASDIAESGFYGIMADESTDASNIGQLVICIRWEDKQVTVC